MRPKLADKLTALGFLAPAVIILLAFGLFPIAYAIYVGLHRWRIRKEELIGFGNFTRALGDPVYVLWLVIGLAVAWGAVRLYSRQMRSAKAMLLRHAVAIPLLVFAIWLAVAVGLGGMVETGDHRMYNGFKVTVFYVLGTIPAELAISMALAYLLMKSLRSKSFFRVLFFLPYVTPTIATAVVFRTMFSPHPSSWANRFWAWFGMENQRWLYESKSVVALMLNALGHSYPPWVDSWFPSLALVSIILYNIWVYIGYDTVILLAGLSAIPRHYYEAAEIDGASPGQVFRHITLPLVSPILFFLSMVAVIGTFKAFNHIYIMRTAGARDTTDVLSVAVFDQIFEYHNAGYAAAMAFILFVVILGLTLVQNRVVGARVFYGE
jgi:multiple sugar transport system permease protein